MWSIYENLPFNMYYNGRKGKEEDHMSRLKSYIGKSYTDNTGVQLQRLKCEEELFLPEQKNGHDFGLCVR